MPNTIAAATKKSVRILICIPCKLMERKHRQSFKKSHQKRHVDNRRFFTVFRIFKLQHLEIQNFHLISHTKIKNKQLTVFYYM
jgi:hypothetical protein